MTISTMQIVFYVWLWKSFSYSRIFSARFTEKNEIREYFKLVPPAYAANPSVLSRNSNGCRLAEYFAGISGFPARSVKSSGKLISMVTVYVRGIN